MNEGRSRTIIRFLFVGLPGSLAVGATLFYMVFSRKCESDLLAEFPAPHRPLKASVSVLKCRVTQVFTTQVSLLDVNQTQLPDSPNVLAVRGDTVFGQALGAPEVAIVWATDSSLIVRYDTTRRAERGSNRVAGVTIRYENRR